MKILHVIRRMLRRRPRRWRPAWIRDSSGEVFPATYLVTHGRNVVRTDIGRMIEGYADGSSSRDQIKAWWPDEEQP